MATYTPLLPLDAIEDESAVVQLEEGEVHNLVFSGTGSVGIYAVTDGTPSLIGDFSPEQTGGRLLGPVSYKAIRHQIGKKSAVGYYV